MTDPTPSVGDLLVEFRRRRPRVGLVAGGLGAYWPQFPGLLPQLQESARYVAGRSSSRCRGGRCRLHLRRPGGRGRRRDAAQPPTAT